MVVYLLSAAFLVGVALASAVPIGFAGAGLVLLLGCALLCCVMVVHDRRLLMGAAFLFVCALGILRVEIMAPLSDPVLDTFVGEQVVLEGIVSQDPDVREHSVLVSIDVEPTSVTILATLPAYTEVSYGDSVRVEGILVMPEAFETDTGRTFDYPGFLAVSGIGYQLQNATIEILESGKGDPIYAVLYSLKHRYLSALTRALPEPAAALAGGITAGDKRSLGKDLLEDFRDAGVVHIVVLSGYNVTIIAETLLKMLAFLPRAAGLSFGAISIVLFAVATGAAASIVRASIMAILALLARSVGRTYAITRALALAVVGMVVFNPLILLHDPGFQLSVLATIGLIFVAPLLSEKAVWIPERFGLREVFAATLGTQFTVLPLLLYQTGSLSLVALPVNMIVLVAVPAAMFFSFLAAVVGILFPALAVIAGLPAYALLSYVLGVVAVSVRIPYATLSLPAFSVWIMFGVYVAMFIWLYRLYTKKATSPEGLVA